MDSLIKVLGLFTIVLSVTSVILNVITLIDFLKGRQ